MLETSCPTAATSLQLQRTSRVDVLGSLISLIMMISTLSVCGCERTQRIKATSECRRRPDLDLDLLDPHVWTVMMMMMMMMIAFLLLFLMFSVGANMENSVFPSEDHGARLRGLWKLHMRDTALKGKASSPHPIREEVKDQLLYCRVGIGYHLQILPSGAVGGVHKPTDHCRLKVFAVKQGIVGIRALKSGLYLCMNGDGLAYGAEKFSDECLLKETLEENHYNTYSSLSHPRCYLALSPRGGLRKGHSVGPHQACTHFLPRRAT